MAITAQVVLVIGLLCTIARAETAEEARLPKALAAMPGRADAFEPLVADFASRWSAAEDARTTLEIAQQYGGKLWQQAKERLHGEGEDDDRPLYWARLAMTRVVRDSKPHFPLFAADRQSALASLERASRGIGDIRFPDDRRVLRLLIAGFDPFLLDRDIAQGNPSGASVLALDGLEFPIIDRHGRQRTVHIEGVVFPVRFADFDAGLVEDVMQPWLAGPQAEPKDWFEAERLRRSGKPAAVEHAVPQVDMVVTLSMGRGSFDLERFAGLRRSATVPDNAGAVSAGGRDAPTLPALRGKPLQGAEFIEFSLPAAAMRRIQSPFATNDNRWVRVAPDTEFAAGGLASLYGKTAVEGSGGGYLSNELTYRTLRLRDELGLGTLPVGHLHTPALVGYDGTKLRDIVSEVRAILAAGAGAL